MFVTLPPHDGPSAPPARAQGPTRRALLRAAAACAACAAGAAGGLAACGGGAGRSLPRDLASAIVYREPGPNPTASPASHGKLTTDQLRADAAGLFSGLEVRRVDLVVDPLNWAVMLEDLARLKVEAAGLPSYDNLRNPIRVPAELRYEGRRWPGIGLRFKGSSSLLLAQGGKLPFKLDFDEYGDRWPALDGQRCHGFRELHLKNGWADETLLRDRLAGELLRAFGVPAPRAASCVLHVDSGDGPRHFGLYTLVEDVEDSLLETQLGSDSGNLYKPEGAAATLALSTWNTAELSLENNRKGATYADVRRLVEVLADTALQTRDRPAWKQALESVFDVPSFLRWWAAHQVMQNWDAYGVMPHNYFLYADPALGGRLRWLPWDFNEALAADGRALPLSLLGLRPEWPLAFRVLQDAPWFAEYRLRVREFASSAFEPARVLARIDELAAQVGPHVAAEVPGMGFTSPAGHAAAIAMLRQHVVARQAAALAFSPA